MTGSYCTRAKSGNYVLPGNTSAHEQSLLRTETRHNTIRPHVSPSNVPHTTHISIWHKQYTGSAVTTKVHPLLPLTSKKCSYSRSERFHLLKEVLYIKDNCFFCFSVSSIKTDFCHCMACPQDTNGEGGC